MDTEIASDKSIAFLDVSVSILFGVQGNSCNVHMSFCLFFFVNFCYQLTVYCLYIILLF